jgi:hypothetical protein
VACGHSCPCLTIYLAKMHKGKAETAAGWEQVSDLEAEDLAEVGKLRSAVSVQFDKNNREHHALLCELYVAAFPEKRCSLALGNCVAEEWTDLGFQVRQKLKSNFIKKLAQECSKLGGLPRSWYRCIFRNDELLIVTKFIS